MPVEIYADNAATTKMSQRAIGAMLPYLDQYYANPSSLHAAGRAAAEAIQEARVRIACCLGCSPKEILFTSGGSEADNQAILSAANIGRRTGKKHIISTPVEHHAVLHTLEKLKKEGFEIQLLPVDADGCISAKQAAAAIRPDTALVTVMYANNEIGTVFPISEIGEICREKGVLFHTDAVQAVGHLPVDVKEAQISMLSLSAHKFHGPKGIGVLYARQGIPLVRLMEGGGQESGRRAGTENVPAIMAMAAALEEACHHQKEDFAYTASLQTMLAEGLQKIPNSIQNGSKEHRLPGIVSFCFEGIDGTSLLLSLDERGIRASAGSACTSAAASSSHVLKAIGRPDELARGALRLSLCASNTKEEVSEILKAVTEVVSTLRSTSPLWKAKTEGRKNFLL